MTLLIRLCGLLAATALGLLLTSCAGSEQLPASLVQPLDSALRQQVVQHRAAHRLKVKVRGNLTVQLGNGNVATDAGHARAPVATGQSQAQDNTKAGQHGGAVATAPGASAGATTRTGVPGWAIGVGGLLLLLVGVGYCFRKSILRFF